MRVISGSARGLKLKSPKDLSTRPTTDRIKESLFNIISPYLQEADFLDLFSGTGAIGIEALSRGANSCVFIDYSKESFEIIKQNVESAKFKDKSTIHNMDCLIALEEIAKSGLLFDIIFMDPPYSKNITESILDKLSKINILKEDGIIICEQHIDEDIPIIEGFFNYRIKEYKTTKILFFKNN